MTETATTEPEAAPARKQRVAAYAVCVRDDRVLLARWVPSDGTPPKWTLPGGGIDHGEDPYDAAIREVAEETGYAVRLDQLLGIDTLHTPFADGIDFHGLRIVYVGEIVGGSLRHEVDGSTDRAEWVRLDQIGELTRVELVDIAWELYRTQPPTGSLAAVPPSSATWPPPTR